MDTCAKCGNSEFFLRMKGAQVGKYCKGCGAWFKWVGKNDVAALKMRGIPVLPQNAEPELTGEAPLGLAAPAGHGGFNGYGGASAPPYMEEAAYGHGGGSPGGYGRGYDPGYGSAPDHGSAGCPECTDEDLVALSGTAVRLTIFDGILSVTSPDGQNLFATYKIAYCPMCGRKL